MLDLIGTTFIVAAIALNLNATVTVLPLSPVQRLMTVGIAGLWIGLAIALAGAGMYAVAASPVPVIGAMAALPVLATAVAALLSAKVRAALTAIPLTLLVGLNVVRIEGVFFLLLAAQGRLSGPFPESAGRGDMLVGLTAIPLMLARLAAGVESDRHARPGLGADARNFVGAGRAVPAVWRRHRLDCDLDAAMVSDPDPAGAVLSGHPRHHLRQVDAGA
jgi:hypothetical protein